MRENFSKKEYDLQEGTILVHVTRKKIKNMYLRVRQPDAAVTVSAPAWVSDAELRGFIRNRKEWIKGAQERVQQKEERDKQVETLPPAVEKEYRRCLKREINELILKWEPVMKVHPSGFTIRKMKTRWGSCNVRTRHMNFSLALAGRPRPHLEYVVVHEMTHLLEPSHNARFWGLMEQFLPGAKNLRKELNRCEF